MDIKGLGFEATIVAAEQSEQWLVDAAQEIYEAAQTKGIELPVFAGGVATEATVETGEVDETNEVQLDTSEVRESLFGQLDIAHAAHEEVVDALNTGKRKNKIEVADRETVETEFAAWLTEDRLGYIAEQVAVGRTPHVVATPNTEVDAKTLEKASRKFGDKQPYATDFYSGVVGQCTPAELSGTNPKNGNKVHFNVVFEEFDDELYGTPAAQKAGLTKLQEDDPFLEAPSMLKGLTHVFTLRKARGGTLSGSSTANLTYIRDYTVEPQPVGYGSCVPGLIVLDGGGLVVRNSHVRRDGVGRALVG